MILREVVEPFAAVRTTILELVFDFIPLGTSQRMGQFLRACGSSLGLNNPYCPKFFDWLFFAPCLQTRQFLRMVTFGLIVYGIALANFLNVSGSIFCLLLTNFIIMHLMIQMRQIQVMFLVLLIVGLAPFVLFPATILPSGAVTLTLFLWILMIAPYGITRFADSARPSRFVLTALRTVNQVLALCDRTLASVALLTETMCIMWFVLVTVFASHSHIIPPSPGMST